MMISCIILTECVSHPFDWKSFPWKIITENGKAKYWSYFPFRFGWTKIVQPQISFIHFQKLETFLSILLSLFLFPFPPKMLGLMFPGNFPAVLNGSKSVCIWFFALVLLPNFGLELREMHLNSMIIFSLILQLYDQRQTVDSMWNKAVYISGEEKETGGKISMTRNPSEPGVITAPGSAKGF